jgi:hypothetical protein
MAATVFLPMISGDASTDYEGCFQRHQAVLPAKGDGAASQCCDIFLLHTLFFWLHTHFLLCWHFRNGMVLFYVLTHCEKITMMLQ